MALYGHYMGTIWALYGANDGNDFDCYPYYMTNLFDVTNLLLFPLVYSFACILSVFVPIISKRGNLRVFPAKMGASGR